MSMLEMLAAMLVLLVGLVGFLGTLSSSRASASSAERTAAMTQIGDQTIQAIEALPYTSVADSSAPVQTTTTDTTNPTYYLLSGPVAGSSCTTATNCYQWDPSSSASAEPLDIDATDGKVSPGPTTVVAPSPSGASCTTVSTTNCMETFEVYAFVTDATDSVCSQSGVSCPSATSYKRVTVAVKNTGGGPPFQPLYFSTFVGDDAGGADNPLGATGTAGTTTCLDGSTTVSCLH